MDSKESFLARGLAGLRRVFRSVVPKTPNPVNVNLVRTAASGGCLEMLPDDILTGENMLVCDKFGYTAFHIATKAGKLDKIPERLMTEEHLSNQGEFGLSVFHFAALTGHLDQIPKEWLSAKNLLAECTGNTALHNAGANGHLDQIPVELLTEANLITENAVGVNVFRMAAKNGHLDQLLGLKFSEAIIPSVGNTWYAKNLAILNAKEAATTPAPETTDIELF